jgi:hypothetical protein
LSSAGHFRGGGLRDLSIMEEVARREKARRAGNPPDAPLVEAARTR